VKLKRTMRHFQTCVKIPIVPVSRFRVLLVVRECNSFKIVIMQLTDQFIDSCNHADEFPKNLIGNETFIEYNLIDYHERLNDRASELFSPEDEGYLRFWEYDDENQSKPMRSTKFPPGTLSLIRRRVSRERACRRGRLDEPTLRHLNI
jgi:hypothetical protein